MSKKYPPNLICPCGSGKKYKNCCISKKFSWIIEDGNIKKRIKLNDEVFELLKRQRQRFIDIYGRKPGLNDPVFFEQYLTSDEEQQRIIVDILTQINVDPAIIYAYMKTHRLVTKENMDNLTDLELKEWEDAIYEYEHSIKDSNDKSYSLSDLRESILDIEQKLEKMLLVFSLIIFKCGERNLDIVDDIYQSLKIEDYVLFCITKSFKTLKSIIYQIDRGLNEDALILLRTVYEAYLDIIFILHNPQKLNDLIAQAGLIIGTHEYALNKKGKPDRRIIKDKVSGKEYDGAISTYQKILSSDFQVDVVIYDFLYSYLSSFTHPSISTMENYFMGDKFNPSKPNHSYEAVILCIFISTIILDELQYIDFFDQVIKSDIKNFVMEIKPLLIKLFQDLYNETQEELLHLLLVRTYKIDTR